MEEIIKVGASDHTSYSMRIPNDSVGLLIGRNADTLKMIKTMSGVERI